MRRAYAVWWVVPAVLTVVSITLWQGDAAKAVGAPGTSPERVAGELLVKLRGLKTTYAGSAVVSAIQKGAGTDTRVLEIEALKTDPSVSRVRIAEDSRLAMTLAALKDNPLIQYAEPNWIYRTADSGIPDDPEFGKLWGLQNTGQLDAAGQLGLAGADIGVVPVWQRGLTGNRDVVVAVIDSGVDWEHPDLASNIYLNPGEAGDKSSNGIDDDGNGFVDDVRGWNFAAKNNNPMDDNNHGTHCAGTIGAAGGNGTGVTGVNWKVSILPLKFLTAQGNGTSANSIEAVNYARMMKVRVINNSWGGGGYSKIMEDAIKAARDEGILVINASGNEKSSNDDKPHYPSNYNVENMVAVAATDNRDQLASFSNFGKRTVHVAAPGVKILSTIPKNKYAAASGTSMAAPHVSGIAALLLSVHPEWTYAEIKDRLIRTSMRAQGLRTRVLAKGRVSVANALDGFVPPNDEPEEKWWRDETREMESPHPYPPNSNVEIKITEAGARYIRVVFDRIETEKTYDKVQIAALDGTVVEEISGIHDNYVSEYIKGDTLVLKLVSDNTVNKYGFKATKIQVIK